MKGMAGLFAVLFMCVLVFDKHDKSVPSIATSLQHIAANIADRQCTTDSECMAQCERAGGRNCEHLFEGEEKDE